MQAFTFYASDDKLINRGNQAGKKFTGRDINLRASELAKQVAAEGNALTLGGICQCPTYLSGAGKEKVQAEFEKQIQVFVDSDLDFLLCEVIINYISLHIRNFTDNSAGMVLQFISIIFPSKVFRAYRGDGMGN